MFAFKLISTSESARLGSLKTAQGTIETPFFMPVATKGSVKWLSMDEVESTNTSCLISNAFVLSLQPGLDVIDSHNGLHNFMHWQKPLFTDSGGFQVLSESFSPKLSDEGVTFKNPFDGSSDLFTPEKAIEIQNRLGSDVAMCLDDVPLAETNLERLKSSVERTTSWAKRCLSAHENKKQLLFGISQGGVNQKLREKSTKEICKLNFDGFAVGGLSIGESKQDMFEATKLSLSLMHEQKPRYLMGLGSPEELIQAVSLGVDIFDSCFPTRTSRHGLIFSSEGSYHIYKSEYKSSLKPLDKNCGCFVCRNYSCSYLRHLFKTKEENSLRLLTYHNVFFIQNFMQKIRDSIKENSFSDLIKQFNI